MHEYTASRLSRIERSEIEERFRRSGALTMRKLLEYLPALLLTNLSSLLLVSVDAMVAGHLLKDNAISSINIFYPITVFIGSASVLVATGSSTSLALRMGKNSPEAIRRAKSATFYLTILSTLAVAVLQIPIVYGLIRSYHLSPTLNRLTWQYAVGIMFSMPLGLISTVGVYQLQISGRMKVLMVLSVVEGVSNLLFDLLFTGGLKLGVAGIGYGTAAANLLRALLTVWYLSRRTDMLRFGGEKPTRSDILEILRCGLPETANALMLALRNYLLIRIILVALGETGSLINSASIFCFNLANVLISSIQGAMRPLSGLYTGAEDWKSLRVLMRQCVILIAISVSAFTCFVLLFPALLYRIQGVDGIPAGGLLALRLSSLYYVFRGFNTLFRLYFANREDVRLSTAVTVIGYAALPLLAWGLTQILPPPFLWLSYLLMELPIFALNIHRYHWWARKDLADSTAYNELYLTVQPEDAVESSRAIRRHAAENGIPDRISHRVSICMEEMVAFTALKQNRHAVDIQVTVRFAPDKALLLILDDGARIPLEEEQESQKLLTDTYGLLRKIAKSVEYQYLLNMNYTVFRF